MPPLVENPGVVGRGGPGFHLDFTFRTRLRQLHSARQWLLIYLGAALLLLCDSLLWEEFFLARWLHSLQRSLLQNYEEEEFEYPAYLGVVKPVSALGIWIELALLALSGLCALCYLILYLVTWLLDPHPPAHTPPPTSLTLTQRRLLGITDSEAYIFDGPKDESPVSKEVIFERDVSPQNLQLDWLFDMRSPRRNRGVSVVPASPYTPGSSFGASEDGSPWTSRSSIDSYPTPNASDWSPDFSPDRGSQWRLRAPHNVTSDWSQLSGWMEGHNFGDQSPPTPSEILARLRRARSASPLALGVTNKQQLDCYLDKWTNAEKQKQISANQSFGGFALNGGLDRGAGSPWSPGSWNLPEAPKHMGQRFSQLPARPHKYHVSTPDPPPPPTRSNSMVLGSIGNSMETMSQRSGTGVIRGHPGSSQRAEPIGASLLNANLSTVCVTFDLDLTSMDAYCEHLRMWVSRTIVKPLVAQIDRINAKLVNIGRSDLRLGDVSLATLHHAMTTPQVSSVENLFRVLCYLELSSCQDYLVGRLRDLAQDGCLGAFDWDGGASYQRRPWDDHLPNDAQIVWHLFCTYLDSVLPFNPLYPDGKTFSSQFVLRSLPTAADSEPRGAPGLHKYGLPWRSARIFMASRHPPHFQIIRDGEMLTDCGRGRHNLWQTLVLFLGYYRRFQNGHLGLLSLSSSGLNLDWIFDA